MTIVHLAPPPPQPRPLAPATGVRLAAGYCRMAATCGTRVTQNSCRAANYAPARAVARYRSRHAPDALALKLCGSPSTRDQLLRSFGTGSVQTAIAAAEGAELHENIRVKTKVDKRGNVLNCLNVKHRGADADPAGSTRPTKCVPDPQVATLPSSMQ